MERKKYLSKRRLMKLKALLLMALFLVSYALTPISQSYAASKKTTKKTTKIAQVTGVKATAKSTSTIKITWKKQKNAKKYQVWRGLNKNGKYKLIATTNKNSYVAKGLKANKKYFFKVRVIDGKRKGPVSKAVSATTKKAKKKTTPKSDGKDPEPEPEPEPEPQPEKKDVRIQVFETSDIHGHLLEAGSEPDGSDTQYRLAYISQLVNNARASKEYDDVLLIDGGDIYQGASVSNLSEGNVMRAAMDKMK